MLLDQRLVLLAVLLLCFSLPAWTQTGDAEATDPFADVPVSRWQKLDADRQLAALESLHHDVLIPPFLPEGDTLDATGRSLLARLVADLIERNSDLRVTDPGIVARTFAVPTRTITAQMIDDLAQRMKPRIVIVGHVGHDGEGRLHVRATVQTYEARGGRRQLAGETEFAATDLEISDTRLPYAAFRPLAADIAQAATKATVSTERTRPPEPKTWQVPQDFDELLNFAARSPLERSMYLQFLGYLAQVNTSDPLYSDLFERSLVALESVDDRVPYTALLRARALNALERRPAALEALGRPKDPAGKAYLAYLNADLPTLQTKLERLDDPLLALLAEVDLRKLKAAYRWPPDRERAVAIAERYPAWTTLIFRSLVEQDRWSGYSNAWQKIALDILVPVPVLTAEELVKGKLAAGEAPTEFEFAEATLEHVDAAYELHGSAWLEARASTTSPSAIDLLGVAENSLVANVEAAAWADASGRGNHESALASLSSYHALFPDHPVLALIEGNTMQRLAAKKRGREAQVLRTQGEELARRGFVWSPGQRSSINGSWSMNTTMIQLDLRNQHRVGSREALRLTYQTDFPQRAFTGAGTSPEEGMAQLRNCLEYTLTGFACLASLDTMSKDDTAAENLDRPRPASSPWMKANDHRFIGHPDRVKYLGRELRKAEDFSGEDAMYASAMENGSIAWEPYLRLGLYRTHAGRYDEAAEIFLSYPGFVRPELADAVTLANNAYDGGSILYWAGAWDAARPLYELAANYQDSSNAGLSSMVRIALAHSMLEAATEVSAFRAQRYNSAYAYRDYLALLHVLGESASAWDLFEYQAGQQKKATLWAGAMVGHRMEGADPAQIGAWLATSRHRTAVTRDRVSLAPLYLFTMSTMDRSVPRDLPEWIASLDAGPEITVLPNGSVLAEDRYQNPNQLLHDGPPPETGRQEPRLAMAARGMIAIDERDFEKAQAAFGAMAHVYDLHEFLPYFAWASAKSGNTTVIDRYMTASVERDRNKARESAGTRNARHFENNLAQAFLAAGRGEHDAALTYLNNAINDFPGTKERAFPSYYQVVQIADLLYGDTGNSGYRDFAIERARAFQVIQPMWAWTYAVLGRYLETQKGLQYLATAIHLDENSAWVATVPEERRSAAREWLKRNGPMYALQSPTGT